MGPACPELAANSGPRWGEQFQLTADDVHTDGCPRAAEAHLHLDWQLDAGAHAADPAGRRCRPTGDKTRIAPLPRESFTGYPLRTAVEDRLTAARAEQRGAANPEALLFPTRRGGPWWRGRCPGSRTSG